MIETNTNQTDKSGRNINPVLTAGFYYLDLSDEGYWLIKDRNGKRYTAGYDKQKVIDLIASLNKTHRPNFHQGDLNELFVCWNNHDKSEKCDYVRVI